MPDDDERAPFLPRERGLVGKALACGGDKDLGRQGAPVIPEDLATISPISSMPSVEMSSRRPTNGEMYVAPAFAASSACEAEKHSVTFA